MPFINLPGLTGKVYVPKASTPSHRKHDCPDCYACQMCSDDRCAVCRRAGGTRRRGCCGKTSGEKAEID